MRKLIILGMAGVFLVLAFFAAFKNSNVSQAQIISPIPVPNYEAVSEIRSDPEVNKKNKTVILLLGLDGRKGDAKPRCDAIHFISVDPSDGNIEITNIPRGVPVKLADGLETYLSNACHYEGIDETRKRMRELAKLKEDYTVKVGFSQVQGILRYLNLNPIQTLQFLRARKIYGIGDNQRTHNQGLFIKNLISSKLGYAISMPKTLRYLVYKLADTDMDFDTAEMLLQQMDQMNISSDPDKIIITTLSPSLKLIKDTKYQDLIGQVPQGTKDEEYEQYQNTVKQYLDNLIIRTETLAREGKVRNASELISTPYSQKIWLQVDDQETRYEYHFRLLSLIARYAIFEDVASDLLDFASELEIAGNHALYEKTIALMENPKI